MLKRRNYQEELKDPILKTAWSPRLAEIQKEAGVTNPKILGWMIWNNGEYVPLRNWNHRYNQ